MITVQHLEHFSYLKILKSTSLVFSSKKNIGFVSNPSRYSSSDKAFETEHHGSTKTL